MDSRRVALLREVLAPTGWVEGTARLARAIRTTTRTPGGLLLVGTPTYEPWHLTAHLDDETRLSGMTHLTPTLVRHSPPPGSPAHLSVGLGRLAASGRGESLLVVAPGVPGEGLLERVADARRSGATVVAVDTGDEDLAGLAHERMVVQPSGLHLPGLEAPDGAEPEDVNIEVTQHLLGAAVAVHEEDRRGWRDRLARMLDAASGPAGRR